jgi:hypothetical protein
LKTELFTNVDDAYEFLELEPGTNFDIVKKQYLNLISKQPENKKEYLAARDFIKDHLLKQPMQVMQSVHEVDENQDE